MQVVCHNRKHELTGGFSFTRKPDRNFSPIPRTICLPYQYAGTQFTAVATHDAN
jgi:hypothetical protein